MVLSSPAAPFLVASTSMTGQMSFSSSGNFVIIIMIHLLILYSERPSMIEDYKQRHEQMYIWLAHHRNRTRMNSFPCQLQLGNDANVPNVWDRRHARGRGVNSILWDTEFLEWD